MTRDHVTPAALATGMRLKKIGPGLFKDLFGSPTNATLTLVFGVLIVTILPAFFRWAVLDSTWGNASYAICAQASGACWAFINAKARLIIFGRYPYEEQWRALLAMVIFLGAMAFTADWRRWRRPHTGRTLAIVWLVTLPACAALMAGGVLGLPYVEIDRWSGLPLTLMLSAFGILFALLLSIFLALGRQSELPVVRWICVAYIELIRGVPLISILFMASLMLPIILPEKLVVSKILRAQIAFIMFFAAYMAEVLRGGLQAISKGQYDAADAIGLTYWQSMRNIILPQVFRLTIPSLVNIFIAAFKDTSLVVIISMHDLLGTTNAAITDPEWHGIYAEAYIFTAMIYFIFCGGISWYSQKLERHLKSSGAKS
ncbi:amino acid ABC transporter permease [Bosea sp. 2KB_26]|uniref:amino acid ABC transporter permease n=1 Tax=Bosea sp. 2KB_26 TaxID=3237475 RepID=UPI003F916F02